jgi:hypothetical protein
VIQGRRAKRLPLAILSHALSVKTLISEDTHPFRIYGSGTLTTRPAPGMGGGPGPSSVM